MPPNLWKVETREDNPHQFCRYMLCSTAEEAVNLWKLRFGAIPIRPVDWKDCITHNRTTLEVVEELRGECHKHAGKSIAPEKEAAPILCAENDIWQRLMKRIDKRVLDSVALSHQEDIACAERGCASCKQLVDFEVSELRKAYEKELENQLLRLIGLMK